MATESAAGWFEIADPVVRAIIADKLRVGLRKEDGRRDNQDALDLLQHVYRELADAVGAGAEEIRDLKSYAAVVTYHACAQYLRRRYPARTQLKNKLRYFLTHEPGFAVWETREADLGCGYAGWQSQPLADDRAVHALITDPERIWAKAPPNGARQTSGQVKALDAMKTADWRNILEAILNAVGKPLELDQLLAITGALFRVKDEPPDELPDSSERPPFEDVLDQQQLMRRLWQILQGFEHRWLMAFLLNLPGMTKEARGEIEAFESSSVATRDDIGRLLGMIRQEFEDLGYETPLWPADPGSPESRLGAVWPFLPREDVQIARALRCEKQQVINLRAVAVQKAAKGLKETLAAKKNSAVPI